MDIVVDALRSGAVCFGPSMTPAAQSWWWSCGMPRPTQRVVAARSSLSFAEVPIGADLSTDSARIRAEVCVMVLEANVPKSTIDATRRRRVGGDRSRNRSGWLANGPGRHHRVRPRHAPPTITALKPVRGPWTQNDTYSHVYEIDWDISNITINIARLVLLVDGEYIERVDDLATCANTPGSYYNDNVGLGRDPDDLRTVYYHPAGSTNPNSDGREVTLPAYNNSITNYGEWTTSGIELIGNAHDNGALHTFQGKILQATPMEPQTVERMLIRYGTKHNALVGSGSVADTVFHLHDDGTREERANGIFGVYEPNVDGLKLEVNNVHIIASEADDRRDMPSEPMTMHSSDESTYDAFTWHGGSIRSTSYPTIGAGKSVEVDGMFVDRVGSMIMPSTMTEGNAANNPIEMNRILGRLTIDEAASRNRERSSGEPTSNGTTWRWRQEAGRRSFRIGISSMTTGGSSTTRPTFPSMMVARGELRSTASQKATTSSSTIRSGTRRTTD